MEDPENLMEKLVFVGAGDIAEREAGDVANEKMTEEKKELDKWKWYRLKGKLRKIWGHGIMADYRRLRFKHEARDEMEERRNIYADLDKEKRDEMHTSVMQTLIDRYLEDYEEAVHTAAGEKKMNLSEESKKTGTFGDRIKARKAEKMKQEIKGLVLKIASNRLREFDDISQAKDELWRKMKKKYPEMVGSGMIYADNILEIAQNVRAAVKQGSKMEEALNKIEIVLGRAKHAVRTESGGNVEKIDEKINRLFHIMQVWRISGFIKAENLGLATAGAYALSLGLIKSLSRSKLASLATFGGSALLGGFLFSVGSAKKTKRDLAFHSREMAKGGKEIEEGSKRRELLEKGRFETKPVDDLIQSLQSDLAVIRNTNESEALDSSKYSSKLGEAFQTLAEIEARINVSDLQKVDLISYPERGKEFEKLSELDMARYTAKADLKELFEDGKTINIAGVDGESQEFENFDDAFQDSLRSVTKKLFQEGGDEGVNAKKRIIKELTKSEANKAALYGIVGGVMFGLAGQGIAKYIHAGEVGDFIKRFYDDFLKSKGIKWDWLSKSRRGEQSNQVPKLSTFEQISRWVGEQISERVPDEYLEWADFGEGEKFKIGDKGNAVRLPRDYSLSQSGEGVYSILDPQNNSVMDDIRLDPKSGELDAQSILKLEHQGFDVRVISQYNYLSLDGGKSKVVEGISYKLPPGYDLVETDIVDPLTREVLESGYMLTKDGKDFVGVLEPDETALFTSGNAKRLLDNNNIKLVSLPESGEEGLETVAFKILDKSSTHKEFQIKVPEEIKTKWDAAPPFLPLPKGKPLEQLKKQEATNFSNSRGSESTKELIKGHLKHKLEKGKESLKSKAKIAFAAISAWVKEQLSRKNKIDEASTGPKKMSLEETTEKSEINDSDKDKETFTKADLMEFAEDNDVQVDQAMKDFLGSRSTSLDEMRERYEKEIRYLDVIYNKRRREYGSIRDSKQHLEDLIKSIKEGLAVKAMKEKYKQNLEAPDLELPEEVKEDFRKRFKQGSFKGKISPDEKISYEELKNNYKKIKLRSKNIYKKAGWLIDGEYFQLDRLNTILEAAEKETNKRYEASKEGRKSKLDFEGAYKDLIKLVERYLEANGSASQTESDR
ncbi:MAG: hypothetical protein GF347_03890 [Candidatus Moranbacteria bacterium]|nr:hypothetical protein [Candidatus Moranbacteria bacterium]